MGKRRECYACSLELAMDLVGGKWKMVILWHLRQGTRRFGEIKRLLSGITQKILTQQLRELEEAGVVSRKIYAEMPPKVEYALTERGKSLLPVLEALCDWSSAYAQEYGIALEQSSRCPSSCSSFSSK